MSKQKTFLNGNNPAMQFITALEEPEEQSAPAVTPLQEKASTAPPAGYKVAPQFVETKTRRLQLILQPSLYEKVKAAADSKGLSVNAYISNVLEKA